MSLSEWVWTPHPTLIWIPAHFISSNVGMGTSTFESIEQEKFDSKVDVSTLERVAQSSLKQPPMANLVNLDEFSEGPVVYQLRERYKRNTIYTAIGTILVSINPYQLLPLYGATIVQQYRDASLNKEIKLDPHVYSIAAEAYVNLYDDAIKQKSQAIIISGESGAGKTEATKTVLQYLSEVAGSTDGVEQLILQTNAILEQFGNAKTLRNNNSSRFGKWQEVYFDQDPSHSLSGKILSCRIINYLLEKSRVVYQSKDERNYHVLYSLCAGLDDKLKQEYHVSTAKDYAYLSQSGCIAIPGVNDAKDWDAMIKAMITLQFSETEREEIFRVLIGILQLGNLKPQSNPDKTEITYLPDNENLLYCLKSLGISTKELLNSSICYRSVTVRGSLSMIPLNVKDAIDNRDALVKTLYAKLFDYLVWKMNRALHATEMEEKLADVPSSQRRSVGILDIFGFEVFEDNYFEQLCINWTNEKLQSHFIAYVFRLEQEEYRAEQIDVSFVEFVDNAECLTLIEAPRSKGIISLMDEEIVVPQGSDATLIDKMHRQFAQHKHYATVPKKPELFCIKHYAGPVNYNSKGLLVKNKDKLSDTLEQLMRNGSNLPLISLLWSSDLNNPDTNDTAAVIATVDTMTGKKIVSPKPASTSSSSSSSSSSRKKDQTLGSQFGAALSALLTNLYACTPHYIRTIKPNMLKKPNQFDTSLVLQQLVYSGAFEAIRIRKSGFPFRQEHKEFLQRYRCCLEKADISGLNQKFSKEGLKAAITYLTQHLTPPLQPQQFQIGKTKVFLRMSQRHILDTLRDSKLTVWIIRLQCFFRMCRAKKIYKLLKSVQAHCITLLKGTPSSEELQAVLTSAAERKVKLFIFKQVQWVLDGLLEVERLIDQLQFQLAQPKEQQEYDDLKGALEQVDKFCADYSKLNFLSIPLSKSPHTRIQVLAGLQEQVEAKCAYMKKVEKARAALVQAVANENLQELESAIALAKEVGLGEDETGTAEELLEELKAETRIMANLQAAMDKGDVEVIISQLEATRNITLDDERNAIIASAYEKVKSSYHEKIQQAMKEMNFNVLQQQLQPKMQKLGFTELYNMISTWVIDERSRQQKQKDEDTRLAAERAAEDAKLAADTAALSADERLRIMNATKTRRETEDHTRLMKIQVTLAERDRAISTIPPPPDYTRPSMAQAEAGRPAGVSIAPPPPPMDNDDDAPAPPPSFLIPPPPPTHATRNNSLAPNRFSTASRPTAASIVPPPPPVQSRPSVFNQPPVPPTAVSVSGQHPIDEVLNSAIQKRSLAELEKHLLLAQSQGHASRTTRVAQNMVNILRAEATIKDKLVDAIARVDVERCKKLVKDATTLSYKDVLVEEARTIGFALSPSEVLNLKIRKALPTKNVTLLQQLVKEAHDSKMESSFVEQARDWLATQSATDDWYTKLRVNRTHSLDAAEIEAYRTFIQAQGSAPLDTFVQLRRIGNYAKHVYLTKSHVKETRTQWQKEDIPRSLVKLSTEFCGGRDKSKAMKVTAKQIFKNIRGWMRDVYHSYPATLGYDIVMTGYNEPLLRDEIFCQLVKQTTHNPSIDSLLLGLRLFYLCISTFMPSPPLRQCIFSHLSSWAHKTIPTHACGFSDVSDLATNCYLAYESLVKLHSDMQAKTSNAAKPGTAAATTTANPAAVGRALKAPTMSDVESLYNGSIAKRTDFFKVTVGSSGSKQVQDVSRPNANSVQLPPPPPPG